MLPLALALSRCARDRVLVRVRLPFSFSFALALAAARRSELGAHSHRRSEWRRSSSGGAGSSERVTASQPARRPASQQSARSRYVIAAAATTIAHAARVGFSRAALFQPASRQPPRASLSDARREARALCRQRVREFSHTAIAQHTLGAVCLPAARPNSQLAARSSARLGSASARSID